MSNFVVIGAAGYIAPRHLKAIQETGNKVVAIVDPSDSVGIVDSCGYDVEYFRTMEELVKWLHDNKGIAQYMSVCSPNHLHAQHVMMGLISGLDVICEKPLVIHPINLERLRKLEQDTNNKVNVVLQLRLHPAVKALKRRMSDGKTHDVALQYITPRGKWYHGSWKGDPEKSGGLITNIGIHFFDMLIWVFGAVKSWEIKGKHHDKCCGVLELERAKVDWFLSLDNQELPEGLNAPRRSLTVDGEHLDFSVGFSDLHTEVYTEILSGNGPDITDAEPSLKLVFEMENK